MNEEIWIVGGGSAGCRAALEAAAAGCRVKLWERGHIGGICLNYGCVPAKALLRYADLKEFRNEPVSQSEWKSMRENISAKILLLRNGMVNRLKRAGVEIIQREFKEDIPKGNVSVIFAVGRKWAGLPTVPGKNLFDFRHVLTMDRVPRELAIIGGGVTGMEFAQVFAAMGSHVTVWEKGERILPGFPQRASERYMRACMEQGIDFELGCAVSPTMLDTHDIFLANGAWGIIPAGDKERLRSEGINVHENGILTNEFFETARPGVYAVGDCTGQTASAYDAERTAVYAVRKMLGKKCMISDVSINCACGRYDLVTVGEMRGVWAEAGSAANSYAFITDSLDSYARLYMDEKTGVITGAELMMPHATEYTGMLGALISGRTSVETIASGVFFHPGVSECIKEAAVKLCEKL